MIEADLRSLLRAAMAETSRTGFCWAFDSPSTAPRLNSFFFRKPRLRELLQLVDEVEALRSQFGKPNEGIGRALSLLAELAKYGGREISRVRLGETMGGVA